MKHTVVLVIVVVVVVVLSGYCFHNKDFFRGDETTRLDLAGLDHVITVTAVDGKIFFRNYR